MITKTKELKNRKKNEIKKGSKLAVCFESYAQVPKKLSGGKRTTIRRRFDDESTTTTIFIDFCSHVLC